MDAVGVNASIWGMSVHPLDTGNPSFSQRPPVRMSFYQVAIVNCRAFRLVPLCLEADLTWLETTLSGAYGRTHLLLLRPRGLILHAPSNH